MKLLDRFRRNKKIVLTGRIFDYTYQYWGHASSLSRTDRKYDDMPIFSGYIFASSIKVGDQIKLMMKSGKEALFLVIDVVPCRDPSDMFWIDAYPYALPDGKIS